jgi:predicted DNA-binding transcriptional regulator AlpA
MSTIYGWRTSGYGPPAIKVGKHLRWRPASVIDWVAKQERSAT